MRSSSPSRTSGSQNSEDVVLRGSARSRAAPQLEVLASRAPELHAHLDRMGTIEVDDRYAHPIPKHRCASDVAVSRLKRLNRASALWGRCSIR
jgi:hypothetical protein